MPGTVNISIDSAHPQARISRYLTGACLEDVNHEVYGGIHSQMIFGESFEEEAQTIDSRLDPAFAGLSGTISSRAERTYLHDQPAVRTWQPFRTGRATGRFDLTALRSRRGRQSQRIEFVSGDGEGEVGIENRGLNRWGLNVVAGQPYEGLVVVWAENKAELLLALESQDGSQLYGEAALFLTGEKGWQVHSFQILPEAGDPAARFALKLCHPGAVWLDYVRLEPAPWGRFKGLPVRHDIAGALVDQGLTVLRYGGYMVNTDWEHEGRVPGSGYRWKKMLGPRDSRPPYLGTFYPYNSNGFGILDFVAFCEAAGFLSVPVVNPSESPADVADLVEFLNGDVATLWGARRVAGGHPTSYGVRYLEIGNEERAAGGVTAAGGERWLVRPEYPEMFARLAAAAASRDPSITLIMAPWLWNEAELGYPENRETVRRLLQAARPYHTLWDIHVGGDELDHADVMERYIPLLRAYIDELDPGNKVGFCILEENGWRHNLQRALGHAHTINTVERLSGAGESIVIDTPANCLQAWQQNDNFWDQGQIFYTPSQVWGMPPYYAQQMIAHSYQPLALAATVEGQDGHSLDISATRSDDGQMVVVKAVNLRAQDVPACLTLDAPTVAARGTGGHVHIACLSGGLEAVNSPEEPRRVAPMESEQDWNGATFEHRFPGHSFTVLTFTKAM